MQQHTRVHIDIHEYIINNECFYREHYVYVCLSDQILKFKNRVCNPRAHLCKTVEFKWAPVCISILSAFAVGLCVEIGDRKCAYAVPALVALFMEWLMGWLHDLKWPKSAAQIFNNIFIVVVFLGVAVVHILVVTPGCLTSVTGNRVTLVK